MKGAFIYFSSYFLIIHCLFMQGKCHAQVTREPQGAIANSMADIGIHEQNVFAAHNNPAGLAAIQYWQAGSSLQNKFLIRELNPWLAVAAMKLTPGAIGLEISGFGWDAYRERMLGLAYGMPLGKKLHVGIRLCYIRNIVQGYVNRQALLGDIGAQIQINPRLRFSALLLNPALAHYGGSKEKINPQVRSGFAWKTGNKTELYSQLNLSWKQTPSLAAGISYKPSKRLSLLWGMHSAPWNCSMGAGYSGKGFSWNLSFQWISNTGIVPSSSLLFEKP